MPRVLIADQLSPAAVDIFKQRGIDAEVKVGLSKDELEKVIKDYDGLAVRSATKATGKVIAAATRLRVIGRAGIGIDNIDVKAATAKGIIVMNTPFGNSITTAEHAISLMMALARQIPEADRSTQAGKWEKSKFLGVEVYGKTLGVIGCGNIGSIVADRAVGLRMKAIAFDPFLSPERAVELGVEKVELAHVQYVGWAFRNRAALLPTRAQVEQAAQVVAQARTKLGSRPEILHVMPDYFQPYPKACLHGWGRVFLTVAPDGAVLLTVDGRRHRVWRAVETGRVQLELDGRTHLLEHADAISAAQREAGGDDCLRADMPGVVVAVHFPAEAEVVAGDVVLVIESMKMQQNVVVHRAGRIAELHVALNQSFDKGAALVTLHPEA